MKELGAAVYNCSCLAQDLGKIFEAYWALGVPEASIPAPWPDNFSTSFNAETPLELPLNGTAAAVYFSVGAGVRGGVRGWQWDCAALGVYLVLGDTGVSALKWGCLVRARAGVEYTWISEIQV